MTAFSIGGDWTWTGSTTLNGASQTITATTGNIELFSAVGKIECVSTGKFNLGSLGDDVGIACIGAGTLTINTAVGDIALDSAANLTFTGATAISFSSPDFIMVANPGNATIKASSTIIIDSVFGTGASLQFGTANASDVEIGYAGIPITLTGNTKLILATPALAPNTPLLIDPDGSVHV